MLVQTAPPRARRPVTGLYKTLLDFDKLELLSVYNVSCVHALGNIRWLRISSVKPAFTSTIPPCSWATVLALTLDMFWHPSKQHEAQQAAKIIIRSFPGI